MFNQNKKLAYASMGAAGSRETSSDRRRSSLLFANSEAEDVNAFGFNAQKRSQQQQPGQPPRRQAPRGHANNQDKRTLIIGVAAIAVVVLLLVMIIALIASGDKSIQYEDNVYTVYSKDGSTYTVTANGKIYKTFENPITLRPAADRSFAYVTEQTADGEKVYLLEGKKLELFTQSTVTAVMAYADYEPGVIYESNDRFFALNKDYEEQFTYGANVSNFIMSGDASAIAYTVTENGKNRIKLYRGNSDMQETLKEEIGITPVALSLDGTYLYFSLTLNVNNRGEDRLYYIDTTDEDALHTSMGNEGAFQRILCTNVSGEEVVYTATVGDATVTYLYSMNRKIGKEANANPAIKVSDGTLYPVDPTGETACFESFKETIFQGLRNGSASEDSGDGSGYTTCLLNKKYEARAVQDVKGQIAPDGKYLYYLSAKTNTLYQINLKDKDLEEVLISEDVQDFAITEKGNLYILNMMDNLSFRKPTSEKRTPIKANVEEIAFLKNGNTLYFRVLDSEQIYSTKEGSDAKEGIKFDSRALSELPLADTIAIDKAYVYVKDNADGYCLYYTSNGKSFKQIETACVAD